MGSSTQADRSSSKRKREDKYSPDKYSRHEEKRHKRDSKEYKKEKKEKKNKKDKRDKHRTKSKDDYSHKDSEKEREKEKDRDREREREKERSKDKEKKHTEKEREIDKDVEMKESEKESNGIKNDPSSSSPKISESPAVSDKSSPLPIHDDSTKNGEKDSEKSKEKEKDKEKDKEKEKDRDKSHRDRERDRDKERRERDRERDRERERDRDRARDRIRDRERDRERDRDRERERERDRERDRDRDSHRDRERDSHRDREDKDRRRTDDHHHRPEKDKEEKRTEEDKKRQQEKNEEQEKLEDEMRKRRERVEAWRLERQLQISKKEETETQPSTTKSWSLEDDDDEDDKNKDKEKDTEQSKETEPSTKTETEGDKETTDMEVDIQNGSQENGSKENGSVKDTAAHRSGDDHPKPENGTNIPHVASSNGTANPPPVAQTSATTVMDEVDPLDLFMENINEEVHKLHTLDATKLSQYNKGINSTLKKPKDEKSYSDEEDYALEEEETGDDAIPKWKKKKTLAPVDHSKIEYPHFNKAFYIEVPEIAKMTDEEVTAYRKSLDDIKIRGKDCPKPIKSFTQCGLSDRVLGVIKKLKFEKPTAIQAQAIPAIMSGRDIIGIAKTGSGKTLAFLLPMLRHILDQPPLVPGDGPIGLVLAPTRELAMQIHADFKKFCKAVQLKCACVYGGAGVANQIGDLKRGAEIVVCTPGRMIDMLCTNNGRITNLKRVTFVVLDEADRMFDMGFEPQITKILENVRPNRQTVMFSATFPKPVETAARRTLEKKPLEIVVGGRSIVCSEVTQIVEVLNEDQKITRLFDILAEWYGKGSILIFVERQDSADNLFSQIVQSGIPCLSLHGGKDQLDRDCTIADFKAKVKTVMVATSVAARGLDVKDLQLVINFDVPNHYEDYVHRVGRTGRAGNKGTSITFITTDEERFAPDLVKALESSETPVPQQLKDLCEELQKKKNEGQSVLSHGSGYGGKGYKFDEKEAEKRHEERKRQKKAWGVDEDEEDDPEDINEDEERVSTEGGAAHNRDINIQVINQLQGAPSKQPLSTQVQHAAQKAAALAAAISKPPVGVNKAHFDAELEINDYPQQARWKVTHKDALSSITEWTGAAITTRGTYVSSGRPSAGDRKLFLYIEGPTEHSVKTAKAEIKRILEEAAAQAPPERFIGKYAVL